jgi:hypothetical protein
VLFGGEADAAFAKLLNNSHASGPNQVGNMQMETTMDAPMQIKMEPPAEMTVGGRTPPNMEIVGQQNGLLHVKMADGTIKAHVFTTIDEIERATINKDALATDVLDLVQATTKASHNHFLFRALNSSRVQINC